MKNAGAARIAWALSLAFCLLPAPTLPARAEIEQSDEWVKKVQPDIEKAVEEILRCGKSRDRLAEWKKKNAPVDPKVLEEAVACLQMMKAAEWAERMKKLKKRLADAELPREDTRLRKKITEWGKVLDEEGKIKRDLAAQLAAREKERKR